jgi:hypothetical protein
MLQYNNNFYKSFFKEFETEFNLIKSNWNEPEESEKGGGGGGEEEGDKYL